MSDEDNSELNTEGLTKTEQSEVAAIFEKELLDYNCILDRQAHVEKWHEDRYHEEMCKHPFFMKKLPDNSADLATLMEKLHQLKCTSDYKTPNELALLYKEDGSTSFKEKNYLDADFYFGKGIATQCQDKELLAQLYNNRALAQFKLKSFKQSLDCCKEALKIKPDYLKPMRTAAKCYYDIKDYDQCISYCDKILNIGAKTKEVDADIVYLKAQAETARYNKPQMKDLQLQELKEKTVKKQILNAIKAAKINLDESDIFEDSKSYFRIPIDHVHLDQMNFLVWPVSFTYLEHYSTDFIPDFHERTIMSERFKHMFKDPPMKDDKNYQSLNVNVYFIDIDKKIGKVNHRLSLGMILKQEKFIVRHGVPQFFIGIPDTKFEKGFLLMTEEQLRICGFV